MVLSDSGFMNSIVRFVCVFTEASLTFSIAASVLLGTEMC